MQATDDKQLQLGRTGSNMLGLLLMLPSVIVICVAVYGMLGAWWGGILVIGAVNAILAAVTACWYMADHLEAVKDAAVLSRSVKFVLKFVLAVGAILLFVFIIDPATVSAAAGASCRHIACQCRGTHVLCCCCYTCIIAAGLH